MDDVVAMGGCIFRHNICEYLTCASIKEKWTPNWIFVFWLLTRNGLLPVVNDCITWYIYIYIIMK